MAKCAACKSDIVSGATICPTCRTYQSKWKSFFQFAAPAAGWVSLVFAALAYVVSISGQFYHALVARDDLRIVGFDTRKLVLQNKGDTDIFVSHIQLRSKELGRSQVLIVRKIIKKSEFFEHSFDETKLYEKPWRVGDRTFEESAWRKLLTQGYDTPCSRWRFFFVQDAAYIHLREVFTKNIPKLFKSLPVDAHIQFDSLLAGERKRQQFEVQALPYVNPDCPEWR
jgi:hypothetical protein